MPSRSPIRVLVALVVGSAVIGAATPVAADPARPTDYRSRVLAVDPPLPSGVSITVVGGDAFLQLEVAPGRTAAVPDYEQGRGEEVGPYLRFRADGVVERNESSLAAQVNDDRLGRDPGAAWSPGAAPRWRRVASGGRYAWHDHRIHWMLDRPPTAVDQRGRVDLGGPDGTWTVPITVDGTTHVVTGELVLADAPSPWPWAAVALLAAIVVGSVALLGARRRREVPHVALALGLGAVGVAAAGVAVVGWRSMPPGTGPGPIGSVVAIAGTVLAVAAALALRAGRAAVARAALAGAVAALGSWAVLRRDVLTHAVLPTDLPYGVDRAVTALALGTALGVGLVLAWRPPAVGRPAQTTP